MLDIRSIISTLVRIGKKENSKKSLLLCKSKTKKDELATANTDLAMRQRNGLQMFTAVQKYQGSSKESSHLFHLSSISSALAIESMRTEIVSKICKEGKEKNMLLQKMY